MGVRRRRADGWGGGRVRGRVDGLRGLVPLGLLGVDVDVEPFVVLLVPLGQPAGGDFRGWGALKVGEKSVSVVGG